MPTPTLIVQERCATGEGPIWNSFDRRLYWVDIPRGIVFRYDPHYGSHERCYQGEPVGGLTVQADGALLLFGARGQVLRWHFGQITTLIGEIPAERATRFNDVIADPQGRVFCGTMPGPNHPARLYRLECDGSLSLVFDDVGMANGMGFSPDATSFYLTDTKRGTITRYRYNADSGALSEPTIFARLDGDYPAMDGLTVDAAGRVWSARYGGACLVCYDPAGQEVERIELPTARITSAGFGGDDGRDLYITSAGGDEASPEEDPAAGGLFYLRLATAGRPQFYSRVLL